MRLRVLSVFVWCYSVCVHVFVFLCLCARVLTLPAWFARDVDLEPLSSEVLELSLAKAVHDAGQTLTSLLLLMPQTMHTLMNMMMMLMFILLCF